MRVTEPPSGLSPPSRALIHTSSPIQLSLGRTSSQFFVFHAFSLHFVFLAARRVKILYPILMLVMIWRTVLVRVRPEDALINFTPKEDAGDDGSSSNDRSLLSKMKMGWKSDSSLFSWADKGHWETVETSNEDTRRQGNWFRIGFAPVFVDFTKAGSWFVVFGLIEVCIRARALVGSCFGHSAIGEGWAWPGVAHNRSRIG